MRNAIQLAYLLIVGVVVAAVGYLVYKLVTKGPDAAKAALGAINPNSPDNVFYKGANAVTGTITGDPNTSLGSKIYDAVDTVKGWFGFGDPKVDAPTPKSAPSGVPSGSVNQQLGSNALSINIAPLDTRLLTPINQPTGIVSPDTIKTGVDGPVANTMPLPAVAIVPGSQKITPPLIPDANTDPWLGSGSFMSIVNQNQTDTLLQY
jgi:hypothetical protein